MEKYIRFDIDSKKTIACIVQKGLRFIGFSPAFATLRSSLLLCVASKHESRGVFRLAVSARQRYLLYSDRRPSQGLINEIYILKLPKILDTTKNQP